MNRSTVRGSVRGRGRRSTAALAVTAALAAPALGGCASAAPIVSLDPAPSPAPEVSASVEVVTTALTEVYAHFLGLGEPEAIVSPDATVDVAIEELDRAMDLGTPARTFLQATAFEITARTRTELPQVTAVEIEPGSAEVVGSHDGDSVLTLPVSQRITQSSGPVLEIAVTYAVVLDGDGGVESIEAWDGGLDSGSGLDSPTGAVARFLELVDAGDLEAASYFSGGASSNTTALELLRSELQGAGPPAVVELPQLRLGSQRVVYASIDGQIIGRFEVTLGSTTQVVYQPTS